MAEERLQLRELTRRSEAQLTAKHKEKKKSLRQRIIRIKELIEKCSTAADAVAARIDYRKRRW